MRNMNEKVATILYNEQAGSKLSTSKDLTVCETIGSQGNHCVYGLRDTVHNH